MAQKTRISFEVSATELGIGNGALVRLVGDLGVEVEGESITAEAQSFLLAFRPTDYCTAREAAEILGISEERVKSLVASEKLPHAVCQGRLKFRRSDMRALAADDHQRQRMLLNAPRRVPIRVPQPAAVADNATVATAMGIEERPRKTTEPYVFWMLAGMLAMAAGAIIYQSIWGPPPPG